MFCSFITSLINTRTHTYRLSIYSHTYNPPHEHTHTHIHQFLYSPPDPTGFLTMPSQGISVDPMLGAVNRIYELQTLVHALEETHR
jgi:hypothetical protein